MSLNKDAKHQYRVAVWEDNIVSEDESDAIFSEYYALHTVQVIIGAGTAEVTMQLSLVEEPDEATDADWVDWDTTFTEDTLVTVNQLFRWVRFKRDATTDPVTILLLRGSRANT